MANIITEYPVKTLDGIELLPEGTELTQEVLEELANSKSAESYELLPFMDYGRIRQDLYIFINYTPYKIMEYFKQNDFQTYRHSLMVFLISVFLANKLLPEYRELFSSVIISSTHDIGKTCVPLEMLNKTAPLTIN